jgi:hypothetical protein
MEFTFTLNYQLRDGDEPVDDVVERLGATGCDALVGTRSGRPSKPGIHAGSNLDRSRSCQRALGCEARRAVRQADRNDTGHSHLTARDAIARRIIDPSLQGL